MTGIQRLLSKREKRSDSPSRKNRLSMYLTASPNNQTNRSKELVDPNSVAEFYGLFSDSKPNHSEEAKVKSLRQRIIASKSVLVKDENILWCLRCNFSRGEADPAYDLLCAMTDASEGIIIPYDPNVKLLGAVNRQAVTCFLDSVLFAMFSRLDSFEAMLYNTFEDRPRNRLAFLIRLWVNLLRAGKLVSTDITKSIQDTLAECGWQDACKLRQQDASEAFTFITEKLQLPLMTLKMDMFHAGKQDADDHRFINERLLEVAIPTPENGEHRDLKLEDCLEDYFNNRIEVRRFLERRSTLTLARTNDSTAKTHDSMMKSKAIHVETVEVDDSDTPLTPATPRSSYINQQRPVNRSRAQSIIQERFVPDTGSDVKSVVPNGETEQEIARLRKGSIRKEVLMPAWQFFSLIPWYTNNLPSNDAQVAAHFSSKRPIIGLCLKRYSMTPSGRTVRLDTSIDIPIEIGLPHFIQDDKMDETGPLYGSFKLSLQSVVCHRGNSVDSGHYISLVRVTPKDPNAGVDSWMRFDDMAIPKVGLVDIHQALRDETPYLLFYQIVPVDVILAKTPSNEKPPSYTDSQVQSSGVSGASGSPEYGRSISGSLPPSGRPSFDLPPLDDHRATIMPSEKRRPSTMIFGSPLSVSKSSRSSSQEASRRKSASISRSLSRSSKRLSKTLAGLTSGNKDRDVQPVLQIAEPIAEPKASDESIGGTPEDALARLTGEIPAKYPANDGTVTPEPENKRGRHHDKREKTKHRLSKAGVGGHKAHKAEKPDRECSVM